MKPGVKLIISGIGLFIMGAVIIPLAIVLPLVFRDSDKTQFKVPGRTQIAVEEPGRYYLWNDHQTVFKGKSYNHSKGIPDGIQIKIKNTETDELFDFTSDNSISSSGGGSSKSSIGYVEIKKPVSIEVEIFGGNEDRVFSFSQSGILALLGMMLGGFALTMLTSLLGMALIVWGIVKLVKSNGKGEQMPKPSG